MRRKYYTLVEIFAAMAVFSIVCLVVARFFNGAQKLMTSSQSYSEMYSDVRAFFELMDNDLQTMVYNNKIAVQGVYPFVFSYYPYDGSGTSYNNSSKPFTGYLNNIQKFYHRDLVPEELRRELAYSDASTSNFFRDYSPLLCFISNQNNLPVDARSTLCEIRYTFTPAGTRPGDRLARFDYKAPATSSSSPGRLFTIPSSRSSFPGGLILRSCTYADDKKNQNNAHPSANSSQRDPHDFLSFPLVDENGDPVRELTATNNARVDSIFRDDSSRMYHKVIGRVYRMNITCYKFDTTTTPFRYKKLEMLNLTADSNPSSKTEYHNDPSTNYLTWPPTGSSSINYQSGNPIEIMQLGHPLPDMIKVDLFMLGKQDWNKLMALYRWNSSGSDGAFINTREAQQILSRKLRKFSRNFYLNKVDASNL